MGLKDEPAEENWFCNDCSRDRKLQKPASQAAKSETAVNQADEDKQDFCEVCQLSGRLMICDYCPKAYHPTCISQFFRAEDLANDEAKWRCPICEGHSILKREVGITYTTAQLKGRMADRNKENRRKSETLRQRRNRFLKANLGQHVFHFFRLAVVFKKIIHWLAKAFFKTIFKSEYLKY
jgi:hypothetical protein